MELKQIVRMAAAKKGINGITELSRICDLSYPRTLKIWRGDKSSKLADLETVLNVLDVKVRYEF